MTSYVAIIYQILYFLHCKKIPLLPSLLNKLLIRIPCACQIGMGAVIGSGTKLGYGGLGVVIHPRAIIGSNVEVGSNVTIGGTSGKYGVPRIGDNVIISSGAKIIGDIHVGDNTIIGANAVVLTDIPSNCVAVGVPAKVIKSEINIESYK
jgi:serine O-acetyltransferase